MSTRSIVTSLPDVVCDVCGRRLLRGEHPDVFLAGGRRRNVCELCAPRAVDEGWLRESDGHAVGLPPVRQRRGRSLLERLRQLRDAPDPQGEVVPAPAAADPGTGTGTYDFFEGRHDALEPAAAAERAERTEPAERAFEPEVPGAGARVHGGESGHETAPPVPAVPFAASGVAPGAGQLDDGARRSGDVQAQRALEVFNAGEHPRRVVGIARSLGMPSVSVRPLAQSPSRVAIVIAWELCWYRYEVDTGDEAAGASVVAQGTDLSELNREDLPANAAATDDGRLSLVESVP